MTNAELNKQLKVVRKSELKKLRKTLTKEDYKSLKPAVALLRKDRDYFTYEVEILIGVGSGCAISGFVFGVSTLVLLGCVAIGAAVRCLWTSEV